MDLGIAYLLVSGMRDEAVADKVELVSGRKESESWKEVNGTSLPAIFQTFRKLLAQQLIKRFQLDSTPNKHVLLALQINPSVNTTPDGPLLKGKSAKAELMHAEYKRALRRQAHRKKQNSNANAPTIVATAAAAPGPTPAPTPAPAAAAAAPTPVRDAAAAPEWAQGARAGKRQRTGLLGTVMAQQHTETQAADGDATSDIDKAVESEIDNFNVISTRILAEGMSNTYFEGGQLFNLHKFWADHKKSLPLHFSVYLAEVGCKKAAAANVESVFPGAGKFTEEAKSAQADLLQRMIKMHYNWKYPFLRPTIEEVCKRYKEKFSSDAAAAATPATAPAPAVAPVTNDVAAAPATPTTPTTPATPATPAAP